MTSKETKVYLETKLRNLKRTYAKLTTHYDLINEADEIRQEIKKVENELQELHPE